MRTTIRLALLVALASRAWAQQSGSPQNGTAAALQDCGVHGDIEIICGTRSPEDLELTPDGRYLIATQYLNQGRGGASGGGLELFDLAVKRFVKIPETAEPDERWGDPACPGPLGDALVSHGSSLAKRKDGVWELYVVNHGSRQSIEMFELRQAKTGWTLVWHGCEAGQHDYNDVAILPDGGFVATYPSGLVTGDRATMPPGSPTGYVARWSPGKGESEVPGTRLRGPNGVVVSADGHYMFVNEFSARLVRKYDLSAGKETGSVAVDFLPDNLTWTTEGHLLAAGVKGARGDCPERSGRRCLDGFGVAEIDPATMRAKTIFDSASYDPLISSVSVALKAGESIYIGAFTGNRIVKIPYRY